MITVYWNVLYPCLTLLPAASPNPVTDGEHYRKGFVTCDTYQIRQCHTQTRDIKYQSSTTFLQLWNKSWVKGIGQGVAQIFPILSISLSWIYLVYDHQVHVIYQSSVAFWELWNKSWVKGIGQGIAEIFPILSISLYWTYPFYSKPVHAMYQSSAHFEELSTESWVKKITAIVGKIFIIQSSICPDVAWSPIYSSI